MIVQMFTVTRFFTNCYVVGCQQTKESIIIDPGFNNRLDAENLFTFIDENALTVKHIVNTHGHPDHTCGNGTVKEKVHAPISIHEYDAPMLGKVGRQIAESLFFECYSPPADTLLHNDDTVKIGKKILRVLHTPGHSRGSISLLGENEIFTGDTLFQGSIGRTDFPGGSETDIRMSLKKLAKFPDQYVVYPGHGPKTNIGKEKRGNPFLKWL